MAKEFGRLKNIASFGDIVVVAGYFGREFRVDSYSHEIDYHPTYTEEVIIYDVSDVITGEYLLAYQEDISVIRRAGDAENKTNPPHASSLDMDYGWPDFFEVGWEYVGEMEFVREEDTPLKADEKYSKERADELLDEMRSYKTMIEVFGKDSEKGKEFAEKIKTIENTLRYMTGGTKG